MTFSIVAVDKINNEIGFAGASCVYNAGRIGFVKAELGAISTQAMANFALGPLFMEKLEEKLTLVEILEHFREIDDDLESRQIGMINYDGKAVGFTGSKCFEWAGHITGDGYTCQGNILVAQEVIKAMSNTFVNTKGTLAERLFAALKAGDDAGGDARGKQSARIIVEKKGAGFLGSDRFIDINIEDHEEPVIELGRILSIRLFNIALSEIAKGFEDNKEDSMKKLENFLQGKEEIYTLYGWSYLASKYVEYGSEEKAISIYKMIIEKTPGYKHIFRQLPKAGRLSEEIVKQVLKE